MTAANGNRAASATWLAGSTFIALTVPLALFGAQPLDISLGGLTLRGKFDDYAVHYLGAAAAVSLGFGAFRLKLDNESSTPSTSSTALAISPGTTADLSNPRHSVLTEASLKASGLEVFLDADDAPMVIRPAVGELPASASAEALPSGEPFGGSPIFESSANIAQPEPPQHNPSAPPQSTVQSPAEYAPQLNSLSSGEGLAHIVAEVQAIVEQMSLQPQAEARAQASGAFEPSSSVEGKQTGVPHQANANVGALPLATTIQQSILPSAQSYVSFARSQATAAQSTSRDLQAEMAVLEQVYQIREQMQSLMNQVELIQANLEQTVYPTQRLVPLRAAQTPTYTISAVEPIRAAQAYLPESNYGQMAS